MPRKNAQHGAKQCSPRNPSDLKLSLFGGKHAKVHSLSATYKTLGQNDHTREAAHTHSPLWSLCELTPPCPTAHQVSRPAPPI